MRPGSSAPPGSSVECAASGNGSTEHWILVASVASGIQCSVLSAPPRGFGGARMNGSLPPRPKAAALSAGLSRGHHFQTQNDRLLPRPTVVYSSSAKSSRASTPTDTPNVESRLLCSRVLGAHLSRSLLHSCCSCSCSTACSRLTFDAASSSSSILALAIAFSLSHARSFCSVLKSNQIKSI